jgi:hypothetical protein
VHAFHLVARASAEERIFRRLQSRIGQARHDIATPDPLVGDPALATRVGRGPEAAGLPDAPRSDRQSVDLGPDAAAEARRLVCVRRVTCSGDDAVLQALESLGGWVSRSRHPATRCFLGLNALAFVRVEWEDGHGRVCQSMLAPIAIRLDSARARMDWRALRDALRAHQDAVRLAIDPTVESIDHRLRAITSAITDVQLRRQRALAVADAATDDVLWQAGLFDRRAERELSTGRVAVEGLVRERERRILSLEQANVLTRRPARLLLALLP